MMRGRVEEPGEARVLAPEPLGRAAMRQVLVLCACLCGGAGGLWVVSTVALRQKRGPGRQGSRAALQLCVAWSSMSVGMQVLNKALVTELEAPAIVSVVQMWIAAAAILIPCHRQLWEAPRRQLSAWMAVPALFAAMLLSSFYTYEHVSLSFYAVVRNLTPLVALPVERTIMPAGERPRVSNLVVLSLITTLAGAVMYGWGSGGASAIGVVFAAANALLAVCDRLLQRRLLTAECRGLPSTVCAVMNNALGSLPALLLAGLTSELSTAFEPEHRAAWTEPYVVALLVLSGASGLGICYLGIECQRAISATSFLVLQNFQKVAIVACGVALFGDPVGSPLAAAGLLCSLGGGCLYGRAQMNLQERLRLRLKGGKEVRFG